MANQPTKIRKTYKYRLYTNKRRNKRLHQQINVAGLIWNHALALQKRYYQLTGKYVGLGQMKKHIAKLRMETNRYGFWRDLGSQAVQDVLERLDQAYERFFAGTGGLPQFKKVKKYKSFKLKQAGWKLLDSDCGFASQSSKCFQFQKKPARVKSAVSTLD